MSKKIFSLFVSFLIFFSISSKVEAAPCGNGICQSSQGEDCNSCPADCGVCPTPTPPPPTPTPISTPTPPPSTPTPVSSSSSAPTPVPPSGDNTNNQNQSQTSSSESSEAAAPTPSPTPVPLPTIGTPRVPSGPTDNLTPLISGIYSSLSGVKQIEVSLDGGETWLRANFSNSTYSFRPESLEDGNYEVVARITDTLERVIVSRSETLIIDRLPPIIGGASVSLGNLTIIPNDNGGIQLSQDSTVRYVISTRGGVIKGNVVLGEQVFDLINIKNTNFFFAEITPSVIGDYQVEINVEDGAGRKLTRTMNGVTVLSSGNIIDKTDQKAIEGASVSVFVFENNLNKWVLWDADSFGQVNPHITDTNGTYSYMLPAGKYYIEIGKKGYKKARSEIFTIESTRQISFDFGLQRLTKINFFFLSFFLPSLSPPDSFQVNTDESVSNIQNQELLNSKLPDLQIDKDKFADLKAYDGAPYLITFVSTWSSASLDQILNVQNLHKDNPDLKMLVVFLQEPNITIESLIKRGNYSFDYTIDPIGYTSSELKINLLPLSLFINRSGVVTDIKSGPISGQYIIDKLNSLN